MIDYLKTLPKTLDFFASPYELKIYKESKLSSMLGFILTIICGAIGIAVTITQGQDLILKKKPRVNMNQIYDEDPGNYTIGSNEFFFSFQYSGDIDFILDKTLFDFKIYRLLYSRYKDEEGNDIFDRKRIELEFEKCGESEKYLDYIDMVNYLQNYADFKLKKEELESKGILRGTPEFDEKMNVEMNANFTNDLASNGFSSHLCLKDAEEIVLGGEYTKNFFSNINLRIEKCVNTTDSQTCGSENEMKSLSGANILVYYVNSIQDTSNYKKPYYSIYSSYFIKLDYLGYKTTDLYMSRAIVKSDNGFIFEDYKYTNIWKFDYFREQVLTENGSRLLDIYMNISKNRYIYDRYYMKAQELAALVGGLVKACTIVASTISTFFNRYTFDINLINHFFEIDEQFDGGNENELKYSNTFSQKNLFAGNESQRVSVLSKGFAFKKNLNKDDEMHRIKQLNKEKNNQQYLSNRTNFSNSQHAIKKKEYSERDRDRSPVITTDNKVEKNDSAFQSYNEDPHKHSINTKIRKDYVNIKGLVKQDCAFNNSKSKTYYINNSKASIVKNNARKREKIYYNLSYLDIIAINICCLMEVPKKKKSILKAYQSKLSEHTDYSEVLSQILSYKEFKKKFNNYMVELEETFNNQYFSCHNCHTEEKRGGGSGHSNKQHNSENLEEDITEESIEESIKEKKEITKKDLKKSKKIVDFINAYKVLNKEYNVNGKVMMKLYNAIEGGKNNKDNNE